MRTIAGNALKGITIDDPTEPTTDEDLQRHKRLVKKFPSRTGI